MPAVENETRGLLERLCRDGEEATRIEPAAGSAERRLTGLLALAAAAPAPATFDLEAETAVFSAEDLTHAARAVARYETQVADLFGATDLATIACAYTAATPDAAGTRITERTYRVTSSRP